MNELNLTATTIAEKIIEHNIEEVTIPLNLGAKCNRAIWLSMRGAMTIKVDRLREQADRCLTDLVHRELAHIGIEQITTRKPQPNPLLPEFRPERIINYGVPEAPKKQHLIYVEPLSRDDFAVRNSLDMGGAPYWVKDLLQMQMRAAAIDRAIYVAVCRDTVEIYIDRIKLDIKLANKLIEQRQHLARVERLPMDIFPVECPTCPCQSGCHQDNGTRYFDVVSCRTCSNVTPHSGDLWHCARFNDFIPTEHLGGCPCHILHPDLVPWEMVTHDKQFEALWRIDDVIVRNGEPDAYTFSSHEIIANPLMCAHPDETITALRTQMHARVEG